MALLLGGAQWVQAESGYSVEIDLEQQTAYLIRGRHVVLASPISTGRSGHLTETGSFKIIEKERNHFSSLYGKIVDRNGRTVVADADADMAVPRGGKFNPAPMRYFMRFHEATGMHAVICRVTRHRTAAFGCLSKTRSRSSMRSRSAPRSMCSGEPRGRDSIYATVPSRRDRSISGRCSHGSIRDSGRR
jgi:hypothetical protein